jgi:Uma2 family endonuclease
VYIEANAAERISHVDHPQTAGKSCGDRGTSRTVQSLELALHGRQTRGQLLSTAPSMAAVRFHRAPLRAAISLIFCKLKKKRLDGCKAPDWFFVPNVPKMLGGELRRSYVLWQEHQHPLIVAELVSGNGREEHDITPNKGKFWVYERAIQAEYYVIYDVARKGPEVYRLVNGRYQRLEANAAGRVPIIPLQLELGIWQGTYQKTTTFWLRAWDAKGNLLLIGEEVAAAAKQQLEAEKQRADKLAAKLRELGIAPDSL